MIEFQSDSDGRQRFFRDGAPYIENFEVVASLLLGKRLKTDPFIEATLLLVRGIYEHLADCQATLGKVETLIEEARAENAGKEKIEGLIDICRDLQKLQLKLSDQVVQSINRVLDDVFPR